MNAVSRVFLCGVVAALSACPSKAPPSSTETATATPSATTAPPPPTIAKTERRWIKSVSVPVTSSKGEVVGRLAGGSVVQVRIDGERATLIGARLDGTVPVAALSETKVEAQSFVPALEEALRQFDVDGAQTIAESMLSLDQKSRAALEVLSAVLAGTDWSRSRALLKARGERQGPSIPDAPVDSASDGAGADAAVVGPGKAYVTATALKVRETSDAKGVVVADLGIGAEVEVEEVVAVDDMMWAKVKTRPAPRSTLLLPRTILSGAGDKALDDSVAGFAAGGATRGFVAARYLSTAAPTTTALLASATAAKNGSERSAWLQRALALSPCDAALRRRAVDAAIDGGFFVEAAYDARAPACSGTDVDDAPRAWAACRGRPEVAKSVSFGDPLPSLREAPDLCVEAFERSICVGAGDAQYDAIEASRDVERLMDAIGMDWNAEPTGPRANEVITLRAKADQLWDTFNAKNDIAMKQFSDRVAAIDDAVGNAPLLEVTLPRSSSLWLAVEEASINPDMGFQAGKRTAYRLPPITQSGQRVFVPMPTSQNAVVGIVEADDEDFAKALIASAKLSERPYEDRLTPPEKGRVVAALLLPVTADCNTCWH